MNYVFLSLDIATARRFSSHFIILGYRILFSVNFQWYEFFLRWPRVKTILPFLIKTFSRFLQSSNHMHRVFVFTLSLFVFLKI